MKKNILFGIMTCSTLLFSACSQDFFNNEDSSNPNLTKMSFKVNGTKTALVEDMKVNWLSTDKISLFADGINYQFSNTKGNGASALFEGEATLQDKYYALYPYQEDATISNNVITFNIPNIQSTTKESFATNTNPSVAVSENNELTFKNVCALFRITLDNPTGLRTIKMRGNNNEIIAGNAEVTINDDKKISTELKSINETDKIITLTSNANFETGTYYFVVAPTTFTQGLTLDFYNDENRLIKSVPVNDFDKFEASKYYDLKDNIDLSLEKKLYTISKIEETEDDVLTLSFSDDITFSDFPVDNDALAQIMNAFKIDLTNAHVANITNPDVSEIRLSADKKQIILKLASPIYTDDDVNISYNSDGETNGIITDGETQYIAKFTTKNDAKKVMFTKILFKEDFENTTISDLQMENLSSKLDVIRTKESAYSIKDVNGNKMFAIDMDKSNFTDTEDESLRYNNETAYAFRLKYKDYTLNANAIYVLSYHIERSGGLPIGTGAVGETNTYKSYNSEVSQKAGTVRFGEGIKTTMSSTDFLKLYSNISNPTAKFDKENTFTVVNRNATVYNDGAKKECGIPNKKASGEETPQNIQIFGHWGDGMTVYYDNIMLTEQLTRPYTTD